LDPEVHIPGALHSGYSIEGRGARFCEGAIYHLDLVYHSEGRRRQKIEEYERVAAGKSLEHYYFPDANAVVTRPVSEDPPAEMSQRARTVATKVTDVPFVTLAQMRRATRQEYSVRPALFRGEICCKERLSEMRPSEARVAELCVRNLSDALWPAEGLGLPQVRISYHWLNTEGEVQEWDGPRTPLPRTVPPGARICVLADLRAPATLGKYFLQWDLVIEGVARFSQHAPVAPKITVEVQSTPPPATCADWNAR